MCTLCHVGMLALGTRRSQVIKAALMWVTAPTLQRGIRFHTATATLPHFHTATATATLLWNSGNPPLPLHATHASHTEHLATSFTSGHSLSE